MEKTNELIYKLETAYINLKYDLERQKEDISEIEDNMLVKVEAEIDLVTGKFAFSNEFKRKREVSLRLRKSDEYRNLKLKNKVERRTAELNLIVIEKTKREFEIMKIQQSINQKELENIAEAIKTIGR